MHPMLNMAIRAARNAGSVITRNMDRVDRLTITSKQHNDFVSDVDHMAEQEIIKVLRKAYPSHGILAEESGYDVSNDEYIWVIDPLDGTTNFLHGFPQFAVSIALKHNNKLDQAVIYDPVSQELYTASKGVGAQLNNRRIRVSKQKELDGALLGTGFPFRQDQQLDVYLDTFKALFPSIAGIRRAGSAALDLAYVAAGRLDGFWEIGLKEWDLAAGTLLIREAGGLVSDFNGGENFSESGNIVAGSPKIQQAILKIITPYLSQDLLK